MTMINQTENQTEHVEDEQEILTVENNYWVGLNQCLERLKANPDFQKVITEGYFKDRAINGVSMLCAPNSDGAKRKDLLDEFYAISNLTWYFKMIEHMGSVTEEE